MRELVFMHGDDIRGMAIRARALCRTAEVECIVVVDEYADGDELPSDSRIDLLIVCSQEPPPKRLLKRITRVEEMKRKAAA